MRKILTLFALMTISLIGFADDPLFSVAPNKGHINVDFFMSTTCPHCKKADAFLTSLEKMLPWITVKRHEVNVSKEALIELSRMSKKAGALNFNTPSIFFCDVQWIGFKNSAETGSEIIRGLNYCHDRLLKQGELTPQNIAVLKTWSYANLVETRFGAEKDPYFFTIQMGLMDAINPGGPFVLFLILALLLTKSGRPKRHVFMMFFLLMFAHYIIQLHSESIIENRGVLQASAFIALLIALGSMLYRYIVDNTKQLFSKGWFSFVALFITFLIQQSAQDNLSLPYQQWLMHQNMPIKTYWLFVLSYQLIYLVPLSCFLILFSMFINTNFYQKYLSNFNAYTKLMPFVCVIIAAAYPDAISSSLVGVLVFLVVVLLSRFMSVKYV